jgi:hypothetical protein
VVQSFGGNENHFFNFVVLPYMLQGTEIVELSLKQYQELSKHIIKECNKLQHLLSLEALDEAVRNCQVILFLCPLVYSRLGPMLLYIKV